MISYLFDVSVKTINEHMQNIFESVELEKINYPEIPDSTIEIKC